LDRTAATAWIKRWVGAEAYEVLWRRLFDYKFYDYADSLSAAWIWSRIRRVGRSRYDLLRERLGYIEGGSNTLLQAMRVAIESRGGEILLKSPVSKVLIQSHTVKGIQTPAGPESFQKVISTIPLPFIPRVMPELPKDIIEMYKSVKNIAVVCVIAKLRKQFTDKFWLNTNDPEMDIPGIVEYSNLYPLKQHLVYVPFYMPGEHPKFRDPDDAFLDKVRRYTKKINPLLVDEDFIDMRASRYRYAQPICGLRHLDKLPPVALPVKGLWAADTSYYYPEDRGISESVAFGRNMARMASRHA
jgi:protoporphyrinogen oxidase